MTDVIKFNGANLLFPDDDQVKRAAISMAIEKSLLDISESALQQVASRLYDDYKCYFSDCYEHPEYLTKVLKTLYGNSYISITNSIKKNLVDVLQIDKISDFVEKLSK